MAVSKLAGGIVILIAFIVAGKSQAADLSDAITAQNQSTAVQIIGKD